MACRRSANKRHEPYEEYNDATAFDNQEVVLSVELSVGRESSAGNEYGFDVDVSPFVDRCLPILIVVEVHVVQEDVVNMRWRPGLTLTKAKKILFELAKCL